MGAGFGGGAGVQPAAPFVSVIGSSATRLLADASTTAIPPIYATLLTAVLETIDPASELYLSFTASLLHVGANAAVVAPNVRFRLNGVLLPIGAGATVNMVRNQIMPVAYSVRLPVVAGVQTVVAEWAAFALGVNTLVCNPVSLPDLMHAELLLQEYRLP